MGRKVFSGRRKTSEELTLAFHWGGDEAAQWETELRGRVLHKTEKENVVLEEEREEVDVSEEAGRTTSTVQQKKKKKPKKGVKRKPLFYAWGNKNVEPTVGGVVYGQYMLSHNVTIKPQSQVYPSALRRSKKHAAADRGAEAKPSIDSSPPSPPIPKKSQPKTKNPVAGLHLPRYGSVADCFQYASSDLV